VTVGKFQKVGKSLPLHPFVFCDYFPNIYLIIHLLFIWINTKAFQNSWMPLNDVLICLRFLNTVFLLSLTSLHQEGWLSSSKRITCYFFSCVLLLNELKTYGVWPYQCNGLAGYLHVQSVFAHSNSCVRGTINLSSKDWSAGMRRSMCGPNHASKCMLHAHTAAGLCSAAVVLSIFGYFFCMLIH
jgi:hypothetical protein